MKISRYINQKLLYDVDGNTYLNPRHVDLSMLTGSSYVSKKVQTLKQVSQEVYNSQNYWWILASANNLDPFDIVKIGQVLKCPDMVDIFIQLGKQ